MKGCIEPGCGNSQFGGGYCAYHQYIRHMKGGDLYKPKKHTKAPRRISKKRGEELKSYKQIHQEVWDDAVKNGTNLCIFCGEKMERKENCHHTNKRENKRLLDKKYLTNAHEECHVYKYHTMSYEQLIKEPWWDGYLNRLRVIDEKLYLKEIKKGEKSHKLNPILFEEDKL